MSGRGSLSIQIDTSTAAIDTIDYVATDSAGIVATSTRTVIVEASSFIPADGTSSSASSSVQLAYAQPTRLCSLFVLHMIRQS